MYDVVGCVVVGGHLSKNNHYSGHSAARNILFLDKLSSHDRIYTEILYFANGGRLKNFVKTVARDSEFAAKV